MPLPSDNPIVSAQSILVRGARRNAAIVGVLMSLLAVNVLQAQKISVSVHEDAPDSVAFIVPRQEYDVANAKVRSRDKTVSLLLTDTTLVLQLSQRGMDRVETEVSEAKREEGLAARMVARMSCGGGSPAWSGSTRRCSTGGLASRIHHWASLRRSCCAASTSG